MNWHVYNTAIVMLYGSTVSQSEKVWLVGVVSDSQLVGWSSLAVSKCTQ